MNRLAAMLVGTLLVAAGAAFAYFGDDLYARVLAPLAELFQDRVDPQRPQAIVAAGPELHVYAAAGESTKRETPVIPVRAISWALPALLIGWGLLVRGRWGTLVVVSLLFVAAHGLQAAFEASAIITSSNPPWLRAWREGGQMLALVLALSAGRLARPGNASAPRN